MIQDQGKVFDDTYRQFQELKENLNNFKSHFAAETNGVPVLSKCMELLAARCGKKGVFIYPPPSHPWLQ